MSTSPADTVTRTADLGTHQWLERTGGQLTPAERRTLLLPLAAAQARNVVGRAAMLLRVNSGRRRDPGLGSSRPRPDSALTRAAATVARERLTPVLWNHSQRAYLFGAALGEMEGLDVDRELLLAAALLHDIGLPTREANVDFTSASSQAARVVADQVGLSTAATDTLRTAITLHHTPGVELEHGTVPYLLSAGAGVDVAGIRSWQLPPDLLAAAVAQHPRLGFKREFGAAWRTEASRVPTGRAALLRRYGAFDLAIKAAPFRG